MVVKRSSEEFEKLRQKAIDLDNEREKVHQEVVRNLNILEEVIHKNVISKLSRLELEWMHH